MSSPETDDAPALFEGLDDPLREQLPTFEVFFKTFGFKRIHGRVWGLLVLAGQPLSSKEISQELGSSVGATSTTLNELSEWGAITSCFDSTRRCHLHSPVGNTLSIVATVLRRREQVIFNQFKAGATRTLEYVKQRYGPRDPRALTLRSIISSCEIAEAVMQLVFSSVGSALGDPESVLSKAIYTALKIGRVPARVLGGGRRLAARGDGDDEEVDEHDGHGPGGEEPGGEGPGREEPGREGPGRAGHGRDGHGLGAEREDDAEELEHADARRAAAGGEDADGD